MVDLVARPEYLGWLRRWRDHDLIKVVTGVRRCGKSTILDQFAAELRTEGIPSERIVSLNLEDPAHRDLLNDPYQLYDHVVAQLATEGRHYVILDEVQRVRDFQVAADGLFVHPQVDLYLTGSNAWLLSGDLATLLSGRHIELAMLPLSFAQWWTAHTGGLTAEMADASRDRFLVEYLELGGFPYTLRLDADPAAIHEYLRSLTDTVLVKDVMDRRQIRDTSVFEKVVTFLADNIGNLTCPKAVADALTSAGRKTTQATVESYLSGLTEACLVYSCPRFDVRGKRLLSRVGKYYLVDPGLRTALLGAVRDQGRILENVVFLELVRRGLSPRVGVVGTREIDFVTSSPGGLGYVQVAASVRDPATLERELASLKAAPGYHPRLLLTFDPGTFDHDGITQRNVADWLLDG